MPDALQLPAPWAGLRIALVHDWLTGMRGGEKVLESLCRIFPDAPLYTLVHARGSVSPLIEQRPIKTSIVQRLPSPARLYRHYLPLFPIAIETFDLDDVDLVISTSHCAAKSVVPNGRAFHVCYCHSPMRYAWDQFPHYFGPERVGAVASAALRPVLAWLARWDRATANRVNRFLANSQYVAGRIARYYNRQATVLYPPVDTAFFTPGDVRPASHVLVVSALVPYKRIDIAITAARQARVPLKIVGSGPDLARLRELGGTDVEFCGNLPADRLRDAYRDARAVVLPAEEDFGIVPVEAMACGRPVIAFGRGGACESVEDGVSGFLVPDATADAFADAMTRAADRDWDPAAISTKADRFSVDHFESGFRAFLTSALASPQTC